MGRVLAVEYLTLDGVFEEPLWTQPYFDEEVGAFQGAAMSWADALLLGRVTYEGMSVAWPAMGSVLTRILEVSGAWARACSACKADIEVSATKVRKPIRNRM